MSESVDLFFYDIVGNEVRVGDTFVISSLNYRKPVLNLGLLKEIKFCNKIIKAHYQLIGYHYHSGRIYSTESYFQLDKNIFSPDRDIKTRNIEWIMKISDIEFHLNNKRFSKLFEEKIKHLEIEAKE
jgi:hypothetical protein